MMKAKMEGWWEVKLGDFVDIHNQTRIPLSKMERSKKQGKPKKM
ncbi:hypothetical protein [Candidatus Spongiihabitans sp.]